MDFIGISILVLRTLQTPDPQGARIRKEDGTFAQVWSHSIDGTMSDEVLLLRICEGRMGGPPMAR